jgi:hypothetical protein
VAGELASLKAPLSLLNITGDGVERMLSSCACLESVVHLQLYTCKKHL